MPGTADGNAVDYWIRFPMHDLRMEAIWDNDIDNCLHPNLFNIFTIEMQKR